MTLLLLASFMSSAQAARLPLVVATTLPPTPSEMVVYATAAVDPADALADLEVWFEFGNPQTLLDPLDDSLYARDGDRFVWSYPDGGIEYHDTSRMSSEAAIRPRSAEALWTKADAILDDLGLFDASVFTLQPTRVGRSVVELVDAQGHDHGPRTTSQRVSYGYQLDGWDVFGPGGETTLEFDGTGITSLADAQRVLVPDEIITPDEPQVAIDRWLERAADQDRWTEYLSWVPTLDQVRLTSVRLGYFAPPTGAPCPTLEPVYELRGVVLGHDANGQPTSADFLWWESAVEGRSIPSLGLPFPTQE